MKIKNVENHLELNAFENMSENLSLNKIYVTELMKYLAWKVTKHDFYIFLTTVLSLLKVKFKEHSKF